MVVLSAYLLGSSLALGYFLTRLSIPAGHAFGVLDLPNDRKIHDQPVPLSGGWAVFATVSLVLWGNIGAAWLLRDVAAIRAASPWIAYFQDHLGELCAKILPIYVGALAIFVTGVVDDVRGLSVRSRLIAQIAVATALCLCGVRPHLFFLPAWASTLLGVIWIVGITNAFNFLDGLDGLAAGVALVATTALLTLLQLAGQPNVVFFLASLGGTLLGFMALNWHPARVFLGSSGSLTIGYLLGVSSILVTYSAPHQGHWITTLLIPAFVLSVPLYDTASVLLIRLLQRRPLAKGDRCHFHHRLMTLGFSHRQTVAFIILVELAVALSAIRLVRASLLDGILILVQIACILSLLVLAERGALRLVRLAKPDVGLNPTIEQTPPQESGNR